MSFLEQLKAQKGLGIKPPVVVDEPIQFVCRKCHKIEEGIEDRDEWEDCDETCAMCRVEAKPEKAEITREEWLNKAFGHIAEDIFPGVVPRCRISIGFPAGSRKRQINKTLGQYWPKASASDGVPQIFISPSSGASSDPVYMLAVLVHEMVHACTEGAGHGPEFRRLAIKCGLQPPMRSTTASAQLKKKLKAIAENLGPFPHGTIDPTTRPGKKGKLKGYECSGCGFKMYTTTKWVDHAGGEAHIECPDENCHCPMVFVPPKS